MSSIESMISELEQDYQRILQSLEKDVTKDARNFFNLLSEEEILALIRQVMKFQRKIEYFSVSLEKLAEKTKYFDRIKENIARIIEKLSVDKKFEEVRFYTGYGFNYIPVYGVLKQLKDARFNLLHVEYNESRRCCYCAYFGFRSLREDLVEMEEEMRLIGALTTFPIGEKIRLKHQLVLNDFQEVAVSLEEAESNVETEHFKDCVSRCRDAVEILVALIREIETGEKTEKHFATDLGKIVKLGIFDVGTQKLAQGNYSFLSLRGSHKYDAKKVTVYDAETALKETYSLLEMLLNKYLEFKKTKKSSK